MVPRAGEAGIVVSEPINDMLLLAGEHDVDSAAVSVAGGTAHTYTRRDPEKETSNEDTVAVIPYGPGAAVFVVADGAGGLPAGKRASFTAVNTLAESLQSAMQRTTLLRTAVLTGIEAANEAVLGLGNGSATTMTVITLEGSLARSYQVGDSEALIVGQRGIVRLQTTPHSPTGFAVEAGFLDEREALHHEERHLVSNFIGTNDMTIDVGATIDMKPRDTVLVASDGLVDNVHTEEIIEAVRKGPLDSAIEALTTLADRRMVAPKPGEPCKPDDLSVILFRRNSGNSTKSSSYERSGT